MANDRLFEMLAQAKSQPSKTLRAVESAGKAGTDILGGYLGGKEAGQQLDKYRLLNTPLGQIFSDPSSIPGGLTPNHKVADLLNLTPVLPYIPTEAGGNIATMMLGGSPTTPPPAPIPGSSNPSQNPGDTALNAVQGTGAGAQVNIPPGTSPTVTAPHISKMSMNDLAKYGPMLNDVRQGRQFQEGQANEDRRQRTSIDAENARFGFGKNQEHSQFEQTRKAELNNKKEAIEKEFQDKNDAIGSAQDAIQSSLLLKLKQDKANESGPVKGELATFGSNISNGALDNSTYQLNKNNEFQRTKLQHVQDVNRFNPQEVQFIGGGSLAQPGEPIGVSVQKAQNAINAFQKQAVRNRMEKNAKLAALGLPPDNSPLPQTNVGQWLSKQGEAQNNYSQTATGPNGHKIGSNDGNTWYDIQTGEKI